MQFYLTTEGVYVTRQADAGKGFTSVEVPTDKPSLVVWLNENVGKKPEEPEPAPLVSRGPECPRCKMTPTAVARCAEYTTTEALAAKIMNGSRYESSRLTEAVIEKLRDLKDDNDRANIIPAVRLQPVPAADGGGGSAVPDADE